MSRSIRSVTGIVAASLLVGGCVTTRPGGQPVHDTALEGQPDDVVPYAVVQLVNPAIDSDSDGQIDAIPVVVYVMARTPARDALAVWVDGHLEFTLTGDDSTELASWSFTDQETAAARARTQVGRAYRMGLRLEDATGVTEGQTRAGSLACRFVPTVGDPVESRKQVSVIVGGAGWERVP